MTSATTSAATTGDSYLLGFVRGLMWVFTAIAIAVAIAAIVLPRIIGAVPLTVLTGSMVPTFNPGDLIVSQAVEPSELRPGDIVTFQPESNDPTLITHRVKSVAFGQKGLDHLVTRGDANGTDDQPIQPAQVVGKHIYTVPLLGFVAQAIPGNAKPVILQILGAALALFAVAQFAGVIRERKARALSQPTTHAPDDEPGMPAREHSEAAR